MDPIYILGAGRIGKFMATELGESYPVRVVDSSPEQLERISLPSYQIDVTDPLSLQSYLRSAGLVISAVPGAIGFKVLENILQLGKPVIDISFFPEDPFKLQDLAVNNDTTAVVDSGIAPGFSNMVAGFYEEKMSLQSLSCLVGGLPIKRTLPWQYKAPFSPDDVLEEYTRPVRIKEHGSIIKKEALSDYHLIETPELGTLEAFNTDGLRTLLHTLDIPNMREQTLRYPGHCEKLELLRDSGFFEKEKLEIGGQSISPREFSSKILSRAWQLEKGEEECTYMRIDLEGTTVNRRFEVFDRYDREKEQTSMARCTGHTCLAIAQLYLDGKINEKGIVAPEMLAKHSEHFKYVVDYLKKKQIKITNQTLD